jgi:hypothetical protein
LNFTEKDLQQILDKGLTTERVLNQIALFKKGIPFINLERAATVNDGIFKCGEDHVQKYISIYEKRKDDFQIVKFIPASGAATRMFKALFEFLMGYDPEEESINSYINHNNAMELEVFLVGIEKLPFFEEVVTKLHKKFSSFNDFYYDKQRYEFIRMMLDEDGLNYSFSPKGLLPFHRYLEHISTAFEEHLFEAADYASVKGKAKLHFTISEVHKHRFDQEFQHIEEDISEKTKTEFDISFSYQKQSTDTITVNLDNEPVRDDTGELVFRPSGHGALLENLNGLNADIVFIKNVDNVVVSKYASEISKHKKLLAGVLIDVQTKLFKYLSALESQVDIEVLWEEMINFSKNELNIILGSGFCNKSDEEQKKYLFEKFNKPIRVCGMVRNEGEPGGGPFWVLHDDGEISLQIVEATQVNKKDEMQNSIFKNATHFNPVDLVCGLKDYKGKRFDLSAFIDLDTAFIAMKTRKGTDIKALERPGLWNGSMAHWNTIFIEVPLITFNPVKTINDILKPAHQVL